MGARPVWRVRDRASFDALRRDGRRARRGPISVTVTVTLAHAPGTEARPRVAFSVNRRVGSAAVRNRARRRLRAVVDDLARGATVTGFGGDSDGGTWLVSARSDLSELSASQLRSVVASALSAAVAA